QPRGDSGDDRPRGRHQQGTPTSRPPHVAGKVGRMNNEDKLQKSVDRLARDIAPGRDLWPGIAARIEKRKRNRAPWAYGLAASFLVAVATGGLWFGLAHRVPVAGPAELVASTPSPEAQYFAQRAAFAENSVETAPNLAPETRAVILKNLQIIEGSMQQIEGA